jgi:hypothetical protein
MRPGNRIFSPDYSRRMFRSETGDHTSAVAGAREAAAGGHRQAEAGLLYSLERGGRGELGSAPLAVRYGDALATL